MLTLWTGQRAPADGLYADGHGHQLVLSAGDLAPICMFSGAAAVPWRLIRRLGPVSH